MPQGFPAFTQISLILPGSLEIDATPVANAQPMPNYFGLAEAEYFSKVRYSGVAVGVGHKLQATLRASALRDRPVLTRAATLRNQRSRVAYALTHSCWEVVFSLKRDR